MALYKYGQEIQPKAAPAPNVSWFDKQKQVTPGYSGQQQGVLNQYANQAGQPYYDQWSQQLKAGKLDGTPQYFYDKFAELQKGQDAISKQAQIEKQLAAAGYGQQQQQIQAGMTGAGLGKSGFAGDEMANLAANENFTFNDLHSRMLDLQQSHRQGLQDRWSQESFMRKQERAGKKNRRTQIIAAGLGAAGSIAGGLLTPASTALNQA